jgi:hypothetical protein
MAEHDTLWRVIQRGACIILGSAIIIDSLKNNKPVGELIVGCVVLGVLPIDDLQIVRRRRDRD